MVAETQDKTKAAAERKAPAGSTRPLVDHSLDIDQDQAEIEDIKEQWEKIKTALEQKTLHEHMLLETACALSASLDFKELLSRIADGALKILDAHESDIYMLTEDGKTLNPVVALGSEFISEVLDTPLPVDASITGKAIKAKKTIVINDLYREPGGYHIPETPEDMEERLLVVPLIVDKKVLGALCITRMDINFTKEELHMAEAYASLVSTVLHNAQTHTALEHEVDERARAENALRESEKSYRGLFNTVSDAIYIQDQNGTFLDVNEGAEKMYGHPHRFFPGKTFEALAANEKNDLSQVKKAVKKAFNSEPQTIEFWGQRKNGNVFPGELKMYKGTYLGKEVVIAMCTDITGRKQTEDALRESEARYRNLVELSPDAIGVIADEKIVYMNRAGLRLLGVKSPQDLIGRSFYEIVIAENREAIRNRFTQGIRREDSINPLEMRFLRRDSKQLDVEVSAMSIFYQGRDSIQIVVRDITERVQSQLTAVRANLELQEAYEATLEGWSRALEMRERETAGHSKRVADLTVSLASTLGVPQPQHINIHRGALLHDIGKMSIPDRILLKPEPLNDEEWLIMRQHPVYAYQMLSPITYLHKAIAIPYSHHEHWDGTGYPSGLKGEAIPMAARIFAVVDEWDALTSDRPYRRAWAPEDAREYLHRQSGKRFDPRVVDAFLRIVQQFNSIDDMPENWLK